MWTALLFGEVNCGSKEISIQITHIEANGFQSLHSHPEDQCYYILEGSGIMHIDDEENIVAAGNAVFIPGKSIHGIRNHGKVQLSYLTANTSFGIAREQEIWKH